MGNNYCKICFEEIKNKSFHSLLFKNNLLCEKCFSQFHAKFIHFDIGEVKALAIYEYDDTIRNNLFVFKGNSDIELKDVFLDRYIWYLKFLYKGYIVVPVPSYQLEDDKRGFNHVVEMYNRLNLPIHKVLIKTKDIKQAKQSRAHRLEAIKNFDIRDVELLKNKKVLIVDDVYTTGASVRAAIELVKRGCPKKIAVLVIAKNVEKTHYP